MLVKSRTSHDAYGNASRDQCSCQHTLVVLLMTHQCKTAINTMLAQTMVKVNQPVTALECALSPLR